jgi:hypothetical protein
MLHYAVPEQVVDAIEASANSPTMLRNAGGEVGSPRNCVSCSAAIWMGRRIASPEMFPEAEMLPHLICSRPMFIGGAKDEADQHGGA